MKQRRTDQIVGELVERLFLEGHITHEEGRKLLDCFIDAGKASILDAEVWTLRSALEDVMTMADARIPHGEIFEVAKIGFRGADDLRALMASPIKPVPESAKTVDSDLDLGSVPFGADPIDSPEAKRVLKRFRNL